MNRYLEPKPPSPETERFAETGARSVVIPALVRRERDGIGGTAAYVAALERHLGALGWNVTILGVGPDSREDHGFRSVVARPNALGRHHSWALWRRRNRWDFPPGTVLHLQRPDHVAAFAGGPWPIVLTFHGRHGRTVALRGGSLAGAVYRRIERAACRRANALIFVSRSDHDDVVGTDSALRETACVIPVGVDAERFQPVDRREARKRLNLPEDVRAVGFAGRIAKEKNVPALIDAVERVPGTELWIAGTGPLEDECRRRAGGHVRFVGLLDRDTIPLFLSACDGLALASSHEGLPTVILEAWACGTPVVAPPVGEIPSLLRDGGGVLARSGGVDDLARAVSMLADREPRQDEALVRRAEPYAWSSVARRVAEVYHDAAERARGATAAGEAP